MNTGEASSSRNEQRKVNLLKEFLEITKFEEHSRKLNFFRYDDILLLNKPQLKGFFGEGFGVLYASRLEKIREWLKNR